VNRESIALLCCCGAVWPASLDDAGQRAREARKLGHPAKRARMSTANDIAKSVPFASCPRSPSVRGSRNRPRVSWPSPFRRGLRRCESSILRSSFARANARCVPDGAGHPVDDQRL
jgi:hypothetical protein